MILIIVFGHKFGIALQRQTQIEFLAQVGDGGIRVALLMQIPENESNNHCGVHGSVFS